MPRDETPKFSPRIANRKAFHDYHVLQKLEVGIALQGSEVKSIRQGKVSLAEGFARIEQTSTPVKTKNKNAGPAYTLTLYNVDIAPYDKAHGTSAHEPKRPRRLLAHKREINKLADLTVTGGSSRTLVPLAMYFVRGIVKLELGVGEGKKAFDKRQDLKKREAQRDIQRGMTRKTL